MGFDLHDFRVGVEHLFARVAVDLTDVLGELAEQRLGGHLGVACEHPSGVVQHELGGGIEPGVGLVGGDAEVSGGVWGTDCCHVGF